MGRRTKFIVAGAVTFAVLFVLAVTSVVGMFWWYGRGLEGLDEPRLRNYRPPQVTRVLARDGQVIGEIFVERRTLVDYEKIPSHVENAFLAAEDADFYRHEGMDYFGILRALVANVRAGEIRQGASTITQQVVKIFMLSPERTFERKVQELMLARRLEQALTKREILELYLNELYLGHGRYGIEEASRFYFGKSIRDIDLGEAALLAALPKAPSRDSPLKNPERAKTRQVYVLEQMVRHGFAAARDAQRHIDGDLPGAQQASESVVVRGAEEFVDLARADLEQRYGVKALETLGATVTTTVDLELQAAARSGVGKGLVAVDRRQGYGHSIKPAKDKNRERALKRGAGSLAVGEIYPVVIVEPPDDSLPPEGFAAVIGEHPVFVRVPKDSRYDDPELSYEEQFPVGGITMGRVVSLSGGEEDGLPDAWAVCDIGSGPEAAVLLADVETGEVVAMIGGSDYRRGQFNRATAAKRQPGSAFKPFVYGAALASREFTPATIVSDSPEIYEKWRPTNFQPDVYRGDIRLRVALTHSVNTIAIKLIDKIGFRPVHEFAQAAGIESTLAENLSIALGTSEVTPLELMTAYMTLARAGTRIDPIFITRIEAPGHEPWTATSEASESLGEDVVFVLTSMMRSVVEDGTGKGAKKLGLPVAGKTGTSADYRDAWFGGFTRSHVAVAWVGFDKPKRIGKRETGGRAALPIWLAAMRAATKGVKPAEFAPPPSVSVRLIDGVSGLLAGVAEEGAEAPANTLEEYFLVGTEPVEEAVPAALPAGDVLLDLYADDAEPLGDDPEVLADGARGEQPANDPDDSGLPSLDD